MAANDEFYVSAAQQQLNELSAERLRVQYNLSLSLSAGDKDSAGREIQEIADIEARQANLLALAQREAAKNQPQYQIPDTEREFREKSIERMKADTDRGDWSDIARICHSPKYGPVDVERFKAGIRHINSPAHQSRKATEERQQ